MFILFFFIIGVFFGSFLNVIIDRIPRGESIWVGRSHCDFCHHTLSWLDLFPLFSFLLLQGKCRYCHKFVGWKYPIIESVTGLLFAATYFFLQTSSIGILLITLSIVNCLIVIFFIDLFDGIISNSTLLVLLVCTIVNIFLLHQSPLISFLSASGACILFLLLFFVTRGKGMGFGDVKYAFVMGLLLGFPFIITGLYVAFLTGALVALILVIGRKKGMKSTIAFGPFLVLGTAVHIFFGAQLWLVFQKLLGI